MVMLRNHRQHRRNHVQTEAPSRLLDRVRKLLAKAEDESCTRPEAEALTEKAAELMAKYGIDRALLADAAPETDVQANRILDIDNPWGRIKAHLLCGLARSLRCQAILISGTTGGARVHLFGYQSDLERLDVLYTSLLLQMFSGFRVAEYDRPGYVHSVRAWSRSWLLGFCSAAIARVRAKERTARAAAEAEPTAAGSTSAALVLQTREERIAADLNALYPDIRTTQITYSGTGYSGGYAKGQQADIGGTGVGGRRRALNG
jgi:hypothetical protein